MDTVIKINGKSIPVTIVKLSDGIKITSDKIAVISDSISHAITDFKIHYRIACDIENR